ncbi:MAG: HAMP domain-containing histidine kinase [Alphaproteobacteria bacterium]|nr:HAMP domain-containing histidine kinase [Alphaproteobacteria bacterium]
MMYMNMFPSRPTMVSIDCVVVFSAMTLTLLLFRYREKIRGTGTETGVGLILLGCWIIALMYLYDLGTMLVLPAIIGAKEAMAEMVRLHVQYSWFVHLFGMIFIVTGAIISIFSVVRQLQLLMDARSRAEAASRAKSEFLANMSHELRTPLNAILGFSDLITKGLHSDKPGKYQEYAKDIHTSGEHLLNLVQDLLELSRIEAGSVNFNPEDIQLNVLLEEMVTLMRGEAHKREIVVDCALEDSDLAIWADRRAAKQVILNLLSNAYKHTPAGGTITVKSAKRDDGVVSVSVIDDGSGIPDQVLEHLFIPYWSSDSTTSSGERSYGLGLALSKRLIEAQGGTIDIKSALGQGTTAIITLPAADATARDAA